MPDVNKTDYRSRLTSVAASAFGDLPAGSTVVAQFMIRGSDGRIVQFDAPSGSALALTSAIENANLAEKHRALFVEQSVSSPFGESTYLSPPSHVFDYLAACRVVVINSFAAIEYFTNDVISHFPDKLVAVERQAHAKQGTRSQRRRTVKLPAKCLETSGIQEKIDLVLPQILSMESPKGQRIWEQFEDLRKLRDETVHTRSRDLNPRVLHVEDLNRPSVIRRYLAENPNDWISRAIAVIEYFRPNITTIQMDWLDLLKNR